MPSPTPSTETTDDAGKPSRAGDFLSIDLDLLDPNPFQPRAEIDPAEIEGLAASIAQSGQLQPIGVRPHGPGRYLVVLGERRWTAFRMLLAAAKTDAERRKYALIRAVVVDATTDCAIAVAAYAENAQRLQLNPLEEAAALARIKELGHHSSAKEVAAVTGQAERRVRRLLRLATAPSVVKDCVSLGLLVEIASEGGAPVRARRRIDLMAALEFTRLHQHHLESGAPADEKPAAAAARIERADERTTSAMTRALIGNWGLRRIQRYVEAILNPSPGERTTDSTPIAPAPAVPPNQEVDDSTLPRNVVSTTSERFTLYLSRLKAASKEQLEAARSTIDDARQLIEAQLQLSGDQPEPTS